MKELFFAYRRNGQVVSYSDSPNEYGVLGQMKFDITAEQYEMIKRGCTLSIEDGKLICEKSPRMLKEESEEKKRKIREALIEKKDKNEKVEVDELIDAFLSLTS